MAFLQEQNPLFSQSSISQRENPSYGSELPQDFPYDPGTTSTLFELGYVPRGESWIFFVLLACFVLVTAIISLRKQTSVPLLLKTGFIVAIILVFLGPFTIPSGLRFRTTIGLAKAIGGTLALIAIAQGIIKHKFSIFSSRNTIPIGIYLVSILCSIFFVTNINFFIEDFSLILGGLLFYFVSFSYVDTDAIRNKIISAIGICSLIPTGLVLFIAAFRQQGVAIVNAIYPQYENIVFLFDLSRGRILSIVDIEFFIPCILYMLVFYRRYLIPLLIQFMAMSAAVFLTNYRYRFLSYIAGLSIFFMYTRAESKKRLLLIISSLLTGTFIVYLAITFAFGQVNLVTRFLLQSPSDDTDSLHRRVLMMGQAWEVFTLKPIFGVGLGNYKDNVQISYEAFGGRFYEPFYKILQNVYAYPHNWFLQVLAENGMVGFLAVLYMLYVFGKTDIDLHKKLRGNQHLLFITFSITSWLYIFANQFTPLSNSQPMVIFFWAFRGIISRMHYDIIQSDSTS